MPELLVRLDRDVPRLGEQLVRQLRAALTSGRLAPGTRLPSSRDLAAQLGVSRGVVVTAYEQLLAEGRLVARRGAGTVVGSLPASPTGQSIMTPGTSEGADHGLKSMIDGDRGPGMVLRPGVPDLGLFPRAAWRRAYEEALRTVSDAGLGYGDAAGAARLRVELASYLGRVRAARTDPDAVVVTTGAAQAFAVLARVLREQGTRGLRGRGGVSRERGGQGQRERGEDRIGIEDPGSPVIREHLRANGLTPVPVPVDESGVDVVALRRSGVAAVLVTPAHQYPTGVVLSPRRRAELVEWARGGDRLVIEDDYDAEFRYDREPVGCLQGVAPDVVALVGSASKALAPALRLGWVAVPGRLADAVIATKRAADHSGPTLDQLAFAGLLASGSYDRHLRSVRRAYRRRRDAVLAALRRYLPQARITGIAAGLHLVVELPSTVDDVALARRAAAAGLGPWALSSLRVASAGPPGLVVGYGGYAPDELAGAVRRLASAL